MSLTTVGAPNRVKSASRRLLVYVNPPNSLGTNFLAKAFVGRMLSCRGSKVTGLFVWQKTKQDPIPLAETENFSTTKFLPCRATNPPCNRNQKVSSCWVILISFVLSPTTPFPPSPPLVCESLSLPRQQCSHLTEQRVEDEKIKVSSARKSIAFPVVSGGRDEQSPPTPPSPTQRKRSPTTSLLASINDNSSH
ncbi:hypothetical protein CEXT_524091 [Caerostris extrusa]|uniref:Uncharacterized protein n=1 Tax=Caerostris extrusa TaxID=172846 RepID=A0AAV4WPP9_CAEEX|nr:hypothetical protein CEXT_524091 [Caerostris extrusa]